MSGALPTYRARRPDRLGVHSLDHFAIEVPDPGEARRFYEAFGLDVAAWGDGLELRCFGGPHVWGRILPGARKRLRHLSFGAFADDLPAFAARARAAGVEFEAAPPDMASNGIWFRDANGMLVEVRAAPKVMPDGKRADRVDPAPAGSRGAATRGEAAAVRPTRMAHALVFTPDIARSLRFFADVLGLSLSDHPGPVAFMHGVHGSDHHLVAFAQSRGTGFHHSAWDVASIDEIGLGAARMAEAGYAEGWGLGRHVLGSNYFHYVRDPWGSYAEYSFDIDYVPAEQDWRPGFPPPENSLFLWGPDAPADFVTNHEVAA